MAEALPIPSEYSYPGHDLYVVPRTKDGGEWDFDWSEREEAARLQVESCDNCIITGKGAFPRCTLSFDAGASYYAGSEIQEQVATGKLFKQLTDDYEFLVMAERADTEATDGGSSSRKFLYHGYAIVDRLQLSGRTEK